MNRLPEELNIDSCEKQKYAVSHSVPRARVFIDITSIVEWKRAHYPEFNIHNFNRANYKSRMMARAFSALDFISWYGVPLHIASTCTNDKDIVVTRDLTL